MKKNNKKRTRKILMVVALVLMIALVAAMGSMTYSRYVSSDEMDQAQATVAKWGYVVTIDAADMFGPSYENGAVKTTLETSDNSFDVKSTSTSDSQPNLVAPGTSGSMTISANGTTEVLAQLSVVVNQSQDISITIDDKTYNPIKWSVTGTTTEVTGGSLKDVVDAIETSKKIAVGDSVTITYTISWEWELGAAYADADTDAEKLVNRNDTILGRLVANGTGNSKTDLEDEYSVTIADGYTTAIIFDVTAIVEQIQD